MLLERAFVFGVSGRAILAVAAVAFSVTYALVAAASLSGLQGEGAALEEARQDPGWVLHREPLLTFARSQASEDATFVDYVPFGDARLATIDPWPYESNTSIIGPQVEAFDRFVADDLPFEAKEGVVEFAPPNAIVVPPDVFADLRPGRTNMAMLAYVAGDEPPNTALAMAPWRGVDEFYGRGAAQITASLVLLVLASGTIAAFVSSSFVRLEVLARRDDLATVEAMAGHRTVRRLVISRVAVLAGTGVLVGLAAAWLALRFVAASIGGLQPELDPFVVLLAVLAAGGGSMGLGVLASIRSLDAAAGRGQEGARRFPGPLRYLLVTPRLFPGTSAAALIAVAIVAVVLSTAAIPATMFGGTGEESVLLASEGNPLRGQADLLVGREGRWIEGVAAAMPITYAPTVWKEQALMVRGTDLAAWRHYEDVELVKGEWPTATGEATIGVRAQRTLAVNVGDTIMVPASYHRGIAELVVVGVHQAGGLVDDELVTDAATAGGLAGLPWHKATMVRVRLDDAAVALPQLRPTQGIQVLDVATIPTRPVPNTPAEIEIRVANFGDAPATRVLMVQVAGNLSERVQVRLDSHAAEVLRVPFVTPGEARFRLEVNPTRDVDADDAGLDVVAPRVVRPDEVFTVRVSADAEPTAGAEIRLGATLIGTTDAQGRHDMSIEEPQLAVVSATHGDLSGGTQIRVAPIEWDEGAELRTERVAFGEPSALDNRTFQIEAVATVVNLGGQAWNGLVPWRLDNDTVHEPNVTLASGARTTLRATIEAPFGVYGLHLLGRTTPLAVTDRPPDEDDGANEDPDDAAQAAAEKRTLEVVLEEKRRAAERGAETPEERTEAFLDQLFEDLETASVLVTMATIVHAGAVVWIGVVREVRERAPVVATLRAIGTSEHQLRNRMMRDAALAVGPAVLLGTVAAVIVLRVAEPLGFPAAFGHTLPADLAPTLLLRVAASLLFIALAAGFYALRTQGARPARLPRQRLVDWVRGFR